ncbi:hypothetical protein B0H11DRAFT_1908125 [Mycena galericulata]|nr:hypothetical protein B0H11DRAFT_1908125 [Mycena galericulata]
MEPEDKENREKELRASGNVSASERHRASGECSASEDEGGRGKHSPSAQPHVTSRVTKVSGASLMSSGQRDGSMIVKEEKGQQAQTRQAIKIQTWPVGKGSRKVDAQRPGIQRGDDETGEIKNKGKREAQRAVDEKNVANMEGYKQANGKLVKSNWRGFESFVTWLPFLNSMAWKEVFLESKKLASTMGSLVKQNLFSEQGEYLEDASGLDASIEQEARDVRAGARCPSPTSEDHIAGHKFEKAVSNPAEQAAGRVLGEGSAELVGSNRNIGVVDDGRWDEDYGGKKEKQKRGRKSFQRQKRLQRVPQERVAHPEPEMLQGTRGETTAGSGGGRQRKDKKVYRRNFAPETEFHSFVLEFQDVGSWS